MKKRKLSMLFALVMSTVLVFNTVLVSADETSWEKGYTYNYDYWGYIQYCPDAYTVAKVFTAADFNLEKNFSQPQGMFVEGKKIYLCDTGNNRILEFVRTDIDSVELVREIDSIRGRAGANTFAKPTDICVRDGYLYICDKDNHRIVKIDEDLNFVMEFTKPTDSTFDQSLSFLPNKLAVDAAGRVYCIADNINKGMIRFESDGQFTGFYGATEATYDWTDYIWKKMLSTKEQRAAMENFVPTEYDNIYMDSEGFIFATTTNLSEWGLRDGSEKPLRRLNLMGSDILIKNGNFKVIGDIYWGNAGGYSGPSLLTDVTALDNGVYFALDKVRGRLFGYDTQGNLLYGFGGNGNTDGCFKLPTAIDHMDKDLLVLDATDASFTLFTTTEFGDLIYQAISEYDAGDYEASGVTWQKVMTLDGNYDLAYIGVGRALMRQGEYKKAMEYFRLKWDTDNYSKAFKQYRKLWVEDHVGAIFGIVLILLFVPVVIGRIRKIKWQIDHEDSIRF